MSAERCFFLADLIWHYTLKNEVVQGPSRAKSKSYNGAIMRSESQGPHSSYHTQLWFHPLLLLTNSLCPLSQNIFPPPLALKGHTIKGGWTLLF